MFVPTKAFLTKGVGRHKEKLTSFEMALRDAHLANFNLVRVSSIFPPHCELVDREEGLSLMKPGQVEMTSGEYAEDLAASMLATVLGVPFDSDKAWDERREQWLLSGEIVRTMNITSTAECGDDGRWTTVVSAVCFCG